MAQWLRWLERRPVTAEVEGSSPFRVAYIERCATYNMSSHGIIAQLGEHLPYKQGVIGSSPIGPIATKVAECRSGGTGRRTGLKILRDLYSRTGSIPVCGIFILKEVLIIQHFFYFIF